MASARGNARGNAWAQAITGQTPSLGQRDYSQVSVPAHTRMRPVTVSGAHRGGETVLAAKKGLRRAKAALPVMRPTAAPMGGMPGQGAMSNMPPEGPGGQPFPAKKGAKTVKVKAATGAKTVTRTPAQTANIARVDALQKTQNAAIQQRNTNTANAQRNANATAAARNKGQQGAVQRNANAANAAARQNAATAATATRQKAQPPNTPGVNTSSDAFGNSVGDTWNPNMQPAQRAAKALYATRAARNGPQPDGTNLNTAQAAASKTTQPVGKVQAQTLSTVQQMAAKRGEKTVKTSGSFKGKSNKLGHGGRAAQLKAAGVPGGVIGNLARAAGAAPGGPNFHGAKKGVMVSKAYGR